MTFLRKYFVRWFLLTCVIWLILTAAACTANWITTVQNLIPMIMPAISGILSLISLFAGSAVTPDMLTEVTSYANEASAGLTQLSSLITQYNSAASAEKPGLLGQIDAVAKTVQSSLAQILPTLHISDAAVVAKITAVVNVVTSEVEELVQIIPAIQAKVAIGDFSDELTLDADSPHPLTGKQFRKAYNAAMALPTGNASADAEAAKLVLA